MKRLFVAIKIKPDKIFMNKFYELKWRLRHDNIKWVEDNNIHITLKFFGETEEKLFPEIVRVLSGIALETGIFKLSLRKLGIFGSSYDPRVIWVGIEPYDKLVSSMKLISSRMEPLGFQSDRQNFVPHLTLGRVKLIKDKHFFREVVDQSKGIESQEITIDNFILFESILKKEGPLYTALQTFTLRKTNIDV